MVCGLAALFAGCQSAPPSATAQPSVNAGTIDHGGAILTVAGKNPTYVEALAVEGGAVAFAGDKSAPQKWKGDATKLVDLVILDNNPLKVAPMAIKNIEGVYTIKERKTICSRPE